MDKNEKMVVYLAEPKPDARLARRPYLVTIQDTGNQEENERQVRAKLDEYSETRGYRFIQMRECGDEALRCPIYGAPWLC